MLRRLSRGMRPAVTGGPGETVMRWGYRNPRHYQARILVRSATNARRDSLTSQGHHIRVGFASVGRPPRPSNTRMTCRALLVTAHRRGGGPHGWDSWTVDGMTRRSS